MRARVAKILFVATCVLEAVCGLGAIWEYVAGNLQSATFLAVAAIYYLAQKEVSRK